MEGCDDARIGGAACQRVEVVHQPFLPDLYIEPASRHLDYAEQRAREVTEKVHHRLGFAQFILSFAS